jgi:hypothetical protein
MNPIPPEQDSVAALATDNEERSQDSLLPTVRSTLRTPCASDAWPLKSLNAMLVLIKSSAECPKRRRTEYGIILTVAPVSTNILLTG